MISHGSLGKSNFARSRRLKMLIDMGEIMIAANSKLKIYGTLNCSSGKRMKVENRVLFRSEAEAIESAYRPCGHCMREQYKAWKFSTIKYKA
jgi:methylphosphotriester-DNA--protein-cysteine methyltransferase